MWIGPGAGQADPMNAAPPPPDDPARPDGDSDSAGRSPGGAGPRVSHDDMRDLGRMRRSTRDKKIAGVAAGIARHFDVDPLLVRVVLVVLVFFGGGGILLYAAGWLLLPGDDGSPPMIRLDDRSRTVALTVAGALAALAIVGDAFGGWDFPWPLAIIGVIVVVVMSQRRQHPGIRNGAPPGAGGGPAADPSAAAPGSTHQYDAYRPAPKPTRDPRRRGPILFGFAAALAALVLGTLGTAQLAGADIPVSAYPASVVAVCGLMLLIGAFYGRGGGLIPVGLVAAVAAAATLLTGSIDAGQVKSTPQTAAQVDDEYHVSMGEVQLDLTEVADLDELNGRTVEIDVRMGHVLVTVPEEGLDVTVTAEIDGGGETRLFGDRRDGSDSASHDGGEDVPELTVETDMLFGQIEFETAGASR